MTITFETKCWENDFETVLSKKYLSMVIGNCNYKFDKKMVIINNVNDKEKVRAIAQELINEKVIDAFYFVEDYLNKMLEHFQLNENSFVNENANGFYYSVSELTAIYLCETDYILHFASDVYPKKAKYNWIQAGVKLLQEKNDVVAFRPTFNENFFREREITEKKEKDWFFGYWFTDHCYLAQTSFLKNPDVYKEHNEITYKSYPKYGGRDFEHMIDAYIRNHKLYVAISKNAAYRHQNHTKKKGKRTIKVYYYFVKQKLEAAIFKCVKVFEK